MPRFNGKVRRRRAVVTVGVFREESDIASAVSPQGANRYRAMIDTGATSTGISEKVVKNLSLPVKGTDTYWTAKGPAETNMYSISLSLSIPAIFEDERMETNIKPAEPQIYRGLLVPGIRTRETGAYEVLLGMDVLAKALSFAAKMNLSWHTRPALSCAKSSNGWRNNGTGNLPH